MRISQHTFVLDRSKSRSDIEETASHTLNESSVELTDEDTNMVRLGLMQKSLPDETQNEPADEFCFFDSMPNERAARLTQALTKRD